MSPRPAKKARKGERKKLAEMLTEMEKVADYIYEALASEINLEDARTCAKDAARALYKAWLLGGLSKRDRRIDRIAEADLDALKKKAAIKDGA